MQQLLVLTVVLTSVFLLASIIWTISVSVRLHWYLQPRLSHSLTYPLPSSPAPRKHDKTYLGDVNRLTLRYVRRVTVATSDGSRSVVSPYTRNGLPNIYNLVFKEEKDFIHRHADVRGIVLKNREVLPELVPSMYDWRTKIIDTNIVPVIDAHIDLALTILNNQLLMVDGTAFDMTYGFLMIDVTTTDNEPLRIVVPNLSLLRRKTDGIYFLDLWLFVLVVNEPVLSPPQLDYHYFGLTEDSRRALDELKNGHQRLTSSLHVQLLIQAMSLINLFVVPVSTYKQTLLLQALQLYIDDDRKNIDYIINDNDDTYLCFLPWLRSNDNFLENWRQRQDRLEALRTERLSVPVTDVIQLPGAGQRLFFRQKLYDTSSINMKIYITTEITSLAAVPTSIAGTADFLDLVLHGYDVARRREINMLTSLGLQQKTT
jgi:hypothetical protein